MAGHAATARPAESVRPPGYGANVSQPSLRALIADLIGEELPARPTVAEALASCPAGRLAAAREQGIDLVVAVLDDGRSFVLPDRCPHDGRPLSDGFIEGDRIVCARHGWEIEACSGRRCPASPD
jgi:nitrite reductase/ring-hydroxylating ferredoxin subunit